MDEKYKIPVSREILADMETPLSVYRKLANSPYTYLFESVEGGDKWARYSLIGLRAKKVFKIKNKNIEVFENNKLVESLSVDDPLDFIDKLQQSYNLIEDPNLPKFNGGLVGYFSYDCIRYIEDRLAHSSPPDLSLIHI